jgi:hypothetical protein
MSEIELTHAEPSVNYFNYSSKTDQTMDALIRSC